MRIQKLGRALMKKIITIIGVVLLSSMSMVLAQSVFTTTTDNANNSGAFVADGDMNNIVANGDSNEPIEFYIDQNISPSSMLNATLQIRAVDIESNTSSECGAPELDSVTINGNPLGYLIGAANVQSDTDFSVNPAYLINGSNLVRINISDNPFSFCHTATINYGKLTIYGTITPPDSCVDTDGNNINTQGTVSGFSNGTQYVDTDFCISSNSVNEYTCNGVIPQSVNLSCGTDGFVGDNYCLNDNVVRNYTAHFCSVGTCDSTISPVLINNCSFGCTNGVCDFPPGDDDGDGMNNSYEASNFCLNPSLDDANIDSDNDSAIVKYQNLSIYKNISLTNIQEMVLGLEPCNNDTDGDRFIDGIEIYLNTDANAKCALTKKRNNEPIDAWPLDMNDDQRASKGDISLFEPFMNTSAGDSAFNDRFDLNADGSVSSEDLSRYDSFLNKKCSQI